MAKKKKKKNYFIRLYKSLVIRYKRWYKQYSTNNKQKKLSLRLNKKAKIFFASILSGVALVFFITTYYNYIKIKVQTDLGYTKQEAKIIYKESLDDITKKYGYSKLFIESITSKTYDEKDLELYFSVNSIDKNTRTLFNKLSAKGYSRDELKIIFSELDESNIIKLVVFEKVSNLDDYKYDIKRNTVSDKYLKPYENIVIRNSIEIDSLVNKKFSLSAEYIPDNLVSISNQCSFASTKLVNEAATAFEKMCMDAKSEKIYFASMLGYRSYSDQKSSYDKYAASYGKIQADAQVAQAGSSEHQSGLAVNVSSMASYPANTPFTSKNEYTWLVENASKYGFILRYPEKVTDITGFSSEIDHLRYVGIEIASIVDELKITLEEYHALYK